MQARGPRPSTGLAWAGAICLAVLLGGIYGHRISQLDRELELGVRRAIAGREIETRVSWGRVTLEGTVTSREDRNEMLRAASRLPGLRQLTDRLQVVPVRLEVPELMLSFLDEGGVAVEGLLLPEEAERWTQAIASFGEIRFADLRRRSVVASLADPEAFLAPLRSFDAKEGLALHLRPGQLSLTGRLRDEESKDRLLAGYRDRLPDGWNLVHRMEVPAPVAQLGPDQERLRQLLGPDGIRFEPGSLQITEASLPRIDALAGLLQREGRLAIVIAASGDDRRPTIGKHRADAVFAALRLRGISASRMSTRALDEPPASGGSVRLSVRAPF